MHVSVKSGLSLAVVAAGAALAFRFADAPAPVAPAAAPAVPVVTGPVQQGDVATILSGLGTVQALNTATIRSQVTGLLQTIDFVEGQQVHKDDVLAQVDPRPYQARLAQAEAQLGHDQAQLANVGVNLNRYVPLLSHGFASDQQTKPASTTRAPNSAMRPSLPRSTASPACGGRTWATSSIPRMPTGW